MSMSGSRYFVLHEAGGCSRGAHGQGRASTGAGQVFLRWRCIASPAPTPVLCVKGAVPCEGSNCSFAIIL